MKGHLCPSQEASPLWHSHASATSNGRSSLCSHFCQSSVITLALSLFAKFKFHESKNMYILKNWFTKWSLTPHYCAWNLKFSAVWLQHESNLTFKLCYSSIISARKIFSYLFLHYWSIHPSMHPHLFRTYSLAVIVPPSPNLQRVVEGPSSTSPQHPVLPPFHCSPHWIRVSYVYPSSTNSELLVDESAPYNRLYLISHDCWINVWWTHEWISSEIKEVWCLSSASSLFSRKH